MSTADDKRLQDQMNAANNAGAALCPSRGPRIGDEGRPICSLPLRHEGQHHSDYALTGFDVGWDRSIDPEWMLPLPLADDTPPDSRSEVEALMYQIEAVLTEKQPVSYRPRTARGEARAVLDRVLASDWLAQHDAQVAAKAWDEGYQAGWGNQNGSGRDHRANPYRADRIGGDRG